MKKIFLLILLVLCFSVFAQKKPIITVLDFKIDGVSKSEMRSIISFLSSALFKTGKFVLIDVQERETLLNELEFSMSDCSDESCLLEIGKLLSAEYIVTGNIGKVGSRYLLAIKMLETETGRTSNSVEGVYTSIDEIVDDLYNLAAGLAEVDTEELVMKDKETETVTDDLEEKDNASDTSSNITIQDTGSKKTRTGPPKIAIGAGAGVTFPFGELDTMLESTFTPFTYIDYLFSNNWISFGIGFYLGYQVENTTSEYPDYAYELLSIPVALHSRLMVYVIKPLFVSTDIVLGAAANNVDYEEGAAVDDFMTWKLFLSPGIGLGVSFGSYFRLLAYTTILYITFDRSQYSAYSAGLACEIGF